jgi:hypothetical protein
MADLNFSQPERSNFFLPALIAVVVLGGIFAALFWFNPHNIANITITHAATLPIHTVLKSDSIVVGTPDEAQDDFYVLATVRIEDKLKLPISINDITATLTPAEGDAITVSAAEKNDIPNLYITFPKLKPLGSDPLLRETFIQPGDHAEGMVLVHFPVAESTWNQRKSATITIDLYHQGPQTVTIPKP